MTVSEFFAERERKLRLAGKVSYIEPGVIARKEILKFLFFAKEHAHGRMLDVGCGQKQYEFIFKNNVESYTGLDLPGTELKNGKADVFGDVQDLSFEPNSFDTILCTQVLEHVPDPKKAIEEMSRVLKPGGVLLLTVPMVDVLHELPHDYYRYTEFGLKYMLETAGLNIVHLRRMGNLWRVIGFLLTNSIFNSSLFGNNIVVRTFKRMLCVPISFGFSVLDDINKGTLITYGYCIVAKK